jgi:hypothetical protein
VGNHDLKLMAEDLAKLLTAAPRTHDAPQIDESFFLAAEPTTSPEQKAIDEREELLPELVRSIVEYAITRAPGAATPRSIGEAIGVGVEAAVDQLKLNDESVSKAVNSFLTELCATVRATLTTG